jgi:protein tyrosine/serine phosphatase
MNRRWFLIGALALSTPAFARDAKWAQPVHIEGLPNLNQVDAKLFRSAQPTAQGFQEAENKLHIKTIVNLRFFHSDIPLLKSTNLEWQVAPMNAWDINFKNVVAALKLVKAAEAKGPVLVHCQHGADRTGVVIAMYRILYQGWSKDMAIDEMENGGFNFHSVLANIPAFIKNADIAQFKQALAIAL